MLAGGLWGTGGNLCRLKSYLLFNWSKNLRVISWFTKKVLLRLWAAASLSHMHCNLNLSRHDWRSCKWKRKCPNHRPDIKHTANWLVQSLLKSDWANVWIVNSQQASGRADDIDDTTPRLNQVESFQYCLTRQSPVVCSVWGGNLDCTNTKNLVGRAHTRQPIDQPTRKCQP